MTERKMLTEAAALLRRVDTVSSPLAWLALVVIEDDWMPPDWKPRRDALLAAIAKLDAVPRRYCERCGANVWANNAPNMGNTCTHELPAAPAPHHWAHCGDKDVCMDEGCGAIRQHDWSAAPAPQSKGWPAASMVKHEDCEQCRWMLEQLEPALPEWWLTKDDIRAARGMMPDSLSFQHLLGMALAAHDLLAENAALQHDIARYMQINVDLHDAWVTRNWRPSSARQ